MSDNPEHMSDTEIEQQLHNLQGVQGDVAEDRRRELAQTQHKRTQPLPDDGYDSLYG